MEQTSSRAEEVTTTTLHEIEVFTQLWYSEGAHHLPAALTVAHFTGRAVAAASDEAAVRAILAEGAAALAELKRCRDAELKRCRDAQWNET